MLCLSSSLRPCIGACSPPYSCGQQWRENPMKHKVVMTLAAIAALTLTLNGVADARRMGGGGNLGAQRSITPQKAAPAPGAPAGNTASQTSAPSSQPAAAA